MNAIERGMLPDALAAYRDASGAARIDIESRDDLRLVQLIGLAAASAGYHKPEGTHNGLPYTTAADCSVRGLTNTQQATWIDELCMAGFIPFKRNWPGNEHIHMNWAGAPMKAQLDMQNEDFFAGRDGLVGHRRIDQEWWYPELEARKIPEAMFRISNPRNGTPGRFVTKEDVLPASRAMSYGLYTQGNPRVRLWMPVIDGVSYAPVRAWGEIMGFDVQYSPATHTVQFDSHADSPIAVKIIAGVGHAPIRQLAAEAGLRIVAFDVAQRKVTVGR